MQGTGGYLTQTRGIQGTKYVEKAYNMHDYVLKYALREEFLV